MRGIANIIGTIFLWIVATAVTFGTALVLVPIYLLCVFAGAKKREAKFHEKVRSTAMRDETIAHEALEYRPYALLGRRIGIAVTNSRIISIRRKLLGGFKMRDQQWKDLKDVTIDENIMPGLFGSSMTFEFRPESGAQPIVIYGINSKIASEIYAFAQAQEHAWEEKMRVRDLEEKRAMAGGVNFHSSPAMAATPNYAMQEPGFGSGRLIEAVPSSGGAMDGAASEIARAKSLFDSGAISDAEFQEIKSKILSKYF